MMCSYVRLFTIYYLLTVPCYVLCTMFVSLSPRICKLVVVVSPLQTLAIVAPSSSLNHQSASAVG